MYRDMEMWLDIRKRIHNKEESKRSVQREYGIHFQTLQKILEHPEPPGYRKSGDRKKPKIGPYVEAIAAILEKDKSEKKKQRHTAKRIYERLKEEYGYEGGYTQWRATQVAEEVRRLKQRSAEVFVPLEHRPGEAQVDFGEADVVIGGRRQTGSFFVMTLPFSDAIFMAGYPRECTETFQQGHVEAFEFFEGVPNRISYDNSKIAVIKVGKGRQRVLTKEFLRLQSHHLFDEHFCLVRRPNEKGHVETLVGFGRRNFLVPVPSFESWEALNAYLLERCRQDLERQLRGKGGTKAELLERERVSFLPLPAQQFEARRIETTRANSLSLVRFDRNDYSVPTEYAHREVTAVGCVDQVKLVVDDRLVARHRRSWDKERFIYEPTHYLALLERKPGALDFARPLRDLDLPPAFLILRRRLERQLGSEGTREYIKVLRLLERATIAELNRGIERALAISTTAAEAIRLFVEHGQETTVSYFSLDGHPHLKTVEVRNVDLTLYRTLVEPTPMEAPR